MAAPEPPRSAEELLERLERDGVQHLWVTYLDYSGRGFSKAVPRSSFRSAVRDGIVFAKANIDLDTLDMMVPGGSFTAATGDMLAVPDPESYALLPHVPETAVVQTWLRAPDGSPWEGCPRTRLEAAVAALAGHGYSCFAAFEPEFYLLRREGDEFRPTTTVRAFSETGLAVEQRFVRSVVDRLEAMGTRIPQIGKEYGPGQFEMSIRHAPPVAAVDHYTRLKTVARDTAREQGHVATFMPKVYANWAGCSLHLHLSIWDADGATDLTPSADDGTSISEVGRWFLGGLLDHIEGLTGLGSPTVNSYKRLLPGSFAPANTYWGYGNRSGVVRIPGEGKRRHLELRSGDNSCQPAFFLAGVLAAGLDGIVRKLEPPEPFDGDVGAMTAGEMAAAGLRFLPRDLPTALAALEADPVLTQALGPTATEHFLLLKRHEFARYSTDVHPWERNTYLEVV